MNKRKDLILEHIILQIGAGIHAVGEVDNYAAVCPVPLRLISHLLVTPQQSINTVRRYRYI
jgi:hypothetical protein